MINEARADAGIKPQIFADDEIVMRLISVMANEELFAKKVLQNPILTLIWSKYMAMASQVGVAAPCNANEIGWDVVAKYMKKAATESP